MVYSYNVSDTNHKELAVSDQEKIGKLLRASRVILLDRTTRKWLSQNDLMALRQLEEATRTADTSYDRMKDRAFRIWCEEDEAALRKDAVSA